MFSVRALCIAVALSLAAARGASASPTYKYAFGQSNYVVGGGGTVNVDVYLDETLGIGDTSLLATEGLFGAGMRVFFNQAPVPPHPAQVLTASDISGNANFDDTADQIKSVVSGVSAGIIQLIGLSSPAVFGTGGPPTYRAYLGTFTFHAGNVGNEVTHLRATDFDTMTDDTITNTSLTSLDSSIADSFATITVVPEPGSLTLVAAAGLAGGWWARRRRRAIAAGTPA